MKKEPQHHLCSLDVESELFEHIISNIQWQAGSLEATRSTCSKDVSWNFQGANLNFAIDLHVAPVPRYPVSYTGRANWEDMKDLLSELCMILPVHLNPLLPYLSCLMKLLELSLEGSNELVGLTLEHKRFDAMEDPPFMLDVEFYDFDGPFDKAASLGHAEINSLKTNISDLADIWVPLEGKLALAYHSKLHLTTLKHYLLSTLACWPCISSSLSAWCGFTNFIHKHTFFARSLEMAVRHHAHREPLHPRKGYPLGRPYARGPPMPRPPPIPPHLAVLEEELELQHVEMRRLVADNRRLLVDRTTLQRDLATVKEELHHMNLTIGGIRVEHEVHLKELMDKGMELEQLQESPKNRIMGQHWASHKRRRKLPFKHTKVQSSCTSIRPSAPLLDDAPLGHIQFKASYLANDSYRFSIEPSTPISNWAFSPLLIYNCGGSSRPTNHRSGP
ncbi:hypothetical protein VNO77_19072 [Canavalia gladiata]|uniref:Uncharacterized protein n=1 Tax=Canavalia gladiata TaxID=3824 RepID=A0AAN9QK71_CANGL